MLDEKTSFELNKLIDIIADTSATLAFVSESTSLIFEKWANSDFDYKPPLLYADGLFSVLEVLDLNLKSMKFSITLLINKTTL